MQAPKGTGFVTLTDFGKNQTGWVLDISEQLPNAASIKLFYYNSSLAASPAFLLLLGTDFSDYSPFGGRFLIACVLKERMVAVVLCRSKYIVIHACNFIPPVTRL